MLFAVSVLRILKKCLRKRFRGRDWKQVEGDAKTRKERKEMRKGTVRRPEKDSMFVTGFVLFLAISLLAVCGMAMAGPVPDTGQTKCYDDVGNEIPCPQPGESFYGQDANYNINPQSYTKLDAQGNDLPDSADEWVMVRDNVTELIWSAI